MSTHKIKFTEIPAKLPYPVKYKAALSTAHSEIITYVCEHYKGTKAYRDQVIGLINTASYIILNDNSFTLKIPDPFVDIDTNANRFALGNLFIQPRIVEWDIEPVESKSEPEPKAIPATVAASASEDFIPTPKENIYLKGRTIPRFDPDDVWLRTFINGEEFVMYRSLPIVPEIQRDVTVTTDVNRCTSSDLLKLYPNVLIKTRAAALYQPCESLTCLDDLGMVLPILDFTEDQLIRNIIEYPHFYHVERYVDGDWEKFYKRIEINGELHDTMEVWDSLPDSKRIPKSAEYIKDYVIRRYLLERDILHIDHKYPMWGSLDPFITLFMPAADYKRYGIDDVVATARTCVTSRVSWYQTRNPILRQAGLV